MAAVSKSVCKKAPPAPVEASDLARSEVSGFRTWEWGLSRYGTTNTRPKTWSATISVDAENPVEAAGFAFVTLRVLGSNVGLPDWPRVRVEAVREDVLDEDNTIEQWPDLVTVPDVADMLGVTQQRVRVLAAENKNFPRPAYELRIGKVWLRAAIVKFADEWERKPGRPRRTDTRVPGAYAGQPKTWVCSVCGSTWTGESNVCPASEVDPIAHMTASA